MWTRSSPLFAEPLSCKGFNKKYLPPFTGRHTRPLLRVKEVKGAEDWQEIVGVILCDYPYHYQAGTGTCPYEMRGLTDEYKIRPAIPHRKQGVISLETP